MSSKEKSHSTGPLAKGSGGRTITVPSLSMMTLMTPEQIDYNPVPHNHKELNAKLMWRIFLRFGAAAAHSVVGLKIYSDAVFGRGAGRPTSPDIDLNNLDALKLGVSRRHAMLRPTSRNLYLIDLDSTNGTFVNAVPVGRGMAQVLRSKDTVALGGLSFEIQIIEKPDTAGDSRPLSVDVVPSDKASPFEEDGPATLPPSKIVSPLYQKPKEPTSEKSTKDLNS